VAPTPPQHIAEALSEGDLGGNKKGGLPRKIFERIRSKIESIGHKEDPPRDPEEREG
jgi:hypothetical protein